MQLLAVQHFHEDVLRSEVDISSRNSEKCAKTANSWMAVYGFPA